MIQILNESGQKTGDIDLSSDEIKKLYNWMVTARVFDDRIVKLQREGRCGTYASSLGQEATQVGAAYAMQKSDWMFPYFRELGAHVVRGLPLETYLLYWKGDERGSIVPEDINDFVIAVPVGSQLTHAVGAAMAIKIKEEQSAVLAFLGDGATSKGDFHEAMNFAGVFKSPIVFVCQNNQWAISVPVSKQTASRTISQKAAAYGFDGVRVDGNDVIAVHQATKKALDKARGGGGPTLIECVTYRMSDHTTADDAGKYRPQEELVVWQKKDPITRLEKYMQSNNLLDEKERETIRKNAEKISDEAVAIAESLPEQKPDEIFNHMYSSVPERLERQKEKFVEERSKQIEREDANG